ncbi:MAG: AtpZ/AtpI family protein [Ignavibacteriae bacterium]|nr:MAG: AtpZ/AtpI family protein [Ignavibacteriota bacterium]
MAEKNNKNDENQPSEMQKIASSYRSGWAYAEAPLQYGLAIVICTLIGYGLDELFNTAPILLITGVIIGSVAGFIGLLKSLNALGSKKKDDGNKKT